MASLYGLQYTSKSEQPEIAHCCDYPEPNSPQVSAGIDWLQSGGRLINSRNVGLRADWRKRVRVVYHSGLAIE